MKNKFKIDGKDFEVEALNKTSDRVSFRLNGKDYSFEKSLQDGSHIELLSENKKSQVALYKVDDEFQVFVENRDFFMEKSGFKRSGAVAAEGSLVSPMPGKIFKIVKSEGTDVIKGDTVLIVEAMKMEHSIKANKDGKVAKIFFAEGEQVSGGAQLVEIQ